MSSPFDSKELPGTTERGIHRDYILNSIPLTAVYICDPQGNITYYNGQAAELWGREPRVGDPDQKFCGSLRLYHPDGSVLSHDQTPMATVLKSGTPIRDQQVVIERPDGSFVWVNVNIDPLLDASGHLTGAINVFQDLSDRQTLWQENQRQKELLQKIFDTIPVMITLYRPDTQILQFNREFERVLGWSVEEARQVDMMEMCYPDPDYRAWVRDYMESLEEGWRDIVMTAKDGSQIDSSWANIRLSDDTHVGIGIDIRERKRAELALHDSERLLRAVLDNLPVGVRFQDADGENTFDNTAYRSIWGFPEQAKTDTANHPGSPHGVVHHTGQEQVSGEPLVSRDENVRQEVMEVESLDGTHKIIRSATVPVWSEDGHLVGKVALNEDITELKRVEEELRSLNAALEERVNERTQELAELQRRLMDSVESERMQIAREIHDGPMQEIYALTYAISGIDDDIRTEQLLQEVNDIRSRLLQINEALRSVTRDLRPPELSPFGLERSIREHIDNFQKLYPELKISLDLISDGQTLPEEVRLALFRIYQVAMTNIVRHSGASEASVSFFFDEGQVVLDIQDNGNGFLPPVRWITFARQGHLGLVGAAERAEAIGGNLNVESRPGKGTRIRVTVPRRRE